MNQNGSSWFPLRNFTKSPIHHDWTMGATKFVNCRDELYPEKRIRKYETVFWNRELGNKCIALSSYNEAIRNNDQEAIRKMRDLELPTDIRMV